MKSFRRYVSENRRQLAAVIAGLALLGGLLIYRLGSLTGGLSSGEQTIANTPLGWHGLYHQPLYLPLNLLRSVVFFLFTPHGQTLTRVANVAFGGLTIISFAVLVNLWHNRRTAFLATCLFATSAWTLHVSRLASFDVLYLWASVTLLLIYSALQRAPTRAVVFYGSALLFGLFLYIPGLIWLVLLEIFWIRGALGDGWQHFNKIWQRVLYGLCYLVWLPLLILRLQHLNVLRTWAGLPDHLAAPLTLLKQLAAVFVHLFLRGPQYPTLWLGRIPLLDVFTLACALLGIYVYATRPSAPRSQLLASFFLLGAILVALGGPVGLSVLVPLVYVAVATGLAYLLHRWMRVFPLNPLARGFGLSLVVLAIALSCLYNLRAYFVAWPHNQTTVVTFRYRR